jgi:hypothetical protein
VLIDRYIFLNNHLFIDPIYIVLFLPAATPPSKA